MSDESSSEPRDLAREGARQATRPIVFTVAVLALVAVVGFVLVQRFVLDPYRPGTTHDVTLLVCPGSGTDYVYLGSQGWVATDRVSATSDLRTGRLTIDSGNSATFRPTGRGIERPFARSTSNSPCVTGLR